MNQNELLMFALVANDQLKSMGYVNNNSLTQKGKNILNNLLRIHPNSIVLDIDYYDQLEEDSAFLQDLEDAGVNNWVGFDMACEARCERREDCED